jgi:hypothetical protein
VTAKGQTSGSGRYNWEHRRRRAAMLPAAYGTYCIYCRRVMLEWMPLDYDHTTSRITHASCNRREGARRGNLIRKYWRQRRSTIFPRWNRG